MSRVGHVHVDATIRGRRPASVRFVVDTGATYSLISADLAKRVGIEAGPVRDRVRLASGRTVRLPTALGGIRIEGREAATGRSAAARQRRPLQRRVRRPYWGPPGQRSLGLTG